MTVCCNRSVCSWDQILWFPAPSLTVVMAFRAVSAPMLRSEPGTLLETVAGTMTMGTQNSSYFPRAVNNSSSDRKACRAEPRALVSARGERWQVGLVVEVPQGRETKVEGAEGGSQVYHNGQQRNRQVPLHILWTLSLSHTHPFIHITLTHFAYITGK